MNTGSGLKPRSAKTGLMQNDVRQNDQERKPKNLHGRSDYSAVHYSAKKWIPKGTEGEI